MSIICNQINPSFQPLPEETFDSNAVLTFKAGCGLPVKRVEANIDFNAGIVPQINIPVQGDSTTGTPVLADDSTLRITGTAGNISTTATISGTTTTLAINTGADVPLLNTNNTFSANNIFNGNVTIGNAPTDSLVVNSATTFNLPIGLDSSSGSGTTVTINQPAGQINVGLLTTASGASQLITVNNSLAGTGDMVFATIESYTGTLGADGIPIITSTSNPSSGVLNINLYNAGSNAFNGIFVIKFVLFKFL